MLQNVTLQLITDKVNARLAHYESFATGASQRQVWRQRPPCRRRRKSIQRERSVPGATIIVFERSTLSPEFLAMTPDYRSTTT
jgi:hypothetical protein